MPITPRMSNNKYSLHQIFNQFITDCLLGEGDRYTHGKSSACAGGAAMITFCFRWLFICFFIFMFIT